VTATLDVNVNPKGAVTGAAAAESALNRLGVSAERLEQRLGTTSQTIVKVGAAFAAVTGAYFVVKPILDAADAYTVVNNRLKLVTSSNADLADSYKKVFEIAQRTAAPLEATAKFYSQLALNSKELGLTQEKTMRITETLSKVIALTGQSAEASSNALIQLQQAMGSGALRGDELRSIMEQLPLLAQIIADKMGTTVGKLKEFGEQGAITSKIVADAILASSEDIDKAFSRINFTFAQAFTILKNGFVDFIAKINEASGALSVLSKAIAWVGKEFSFVVTVLGSLAAAWAVLKLATWYNQLSQVAVTTVAFYRNMAIATGTATGFQLAMTRLYLTIERATIAMRTFMFSNPFTAIFAALTIVLPLLYHFRDSIKLSADGSVTLGTVINQAVTYIQGKMPAIIDAFSKVGTVIYDIVKTIGTGLVPVFKAAIAAFSPIIQVIQDVWKAFTGLTSGVDNGTIAIVAIATAINPLLGAFTSIILALNKIDPGLKSVTFAVTVLSEGLGLLLRLAITPLLVSFAAIVSVLNAFGVVSDETALKVGTQVAAFMDFKTALVESGERMQIAYDTMMDGTTTTTQNTKATGDLAKTASGSLAPAFKTTADATKTMADETKKAATSTGDLAKNAAATPKPLNDTTQAIQSSGAAASQAAQQIRDLAAAYRELAQAKASAGSSSGTSGGTDGERANGGPVTSGKRYLVGERGPELFVPGSSGTIVPNGAAQEMQRASGRGGDAATIQVSKAVKGVARAIDGLASSQRTTQSSVQAFEASTQAVIDNSKALKRAAIAYQQAESWKYTATDNNMTLPTSRFGENTPTGVRSYGAPATSVFDADFYSAQMRENRVLKGDEAYRSNNKSGFERLGGSAFSYTQRDSNDPVSQEIASAQARLALAVKSYERFKGVVSGAMLTTLEYAVTSYTQEVEYLTQKQGLINEQLKKARNSIDAYEQFSKALPEMMKAPSSVTDFQTYWQNQGGSVVPKEVDTYKLSNSKGSGQAKEAPTIVNMTIHAKDANSYRNNRAEIEAGLYSMVKSAKRRAGD
jgi:tape measure domain-containing protein